MKNEMVVVNPEIAAMFDGSAELGGDAESATAAVPARRGVVLLAGGGGEPIILMTAADLRARVRARLAERQEPARSRMPDLQAVTARVFWKLATSHFQTDLAFLELARLLWPGGYRQMVGWKPAWFVHVDCGDLGGHFSRTRDVFARRGLYIGPMPDGRSAERFIQALVDGFDLCRDPACLRRGPGGQRCSYAQMGRCLAVCCGGVPVEQYLAVVRQAVDFALGHGRQETIAQLESQMKAAAAELQFERAAAIKARLDRLGELNSPAFARARSAEDFKYILVQPGSRKTLKTFLVCRGSIAAGPVLDRPTDGQQCGLAVEAMEAHAASSPPPARGDAIAMGLVARYIFSSQQRAGLVVEWRGGMDAQQLEQAIGAAFEADAQGSQDDQGPSADQPPDGDDGDASPGTNASPGGGVSPEEGEKL